MDLENSCIICFNTLKDKRHGINSKIKNMIVKFVPTMDIYLSNEHNLCNSCYTSLNKTNMFILTIKKAEERLKNSSKQEIMDLKNESDDEQFVTDHDELITKDTLNGEIKHDNTNIIENEYYEQKFNPEYVIIENEHNVDVLTETENNIVDPQKQAEEILDIKNKLLLLKMSKLECPTCHEIVNILESQTHMENCPITHLSLQKLVPCVDCDMLISKTRLPQHCEKFHVVIQCQSCKSTFESKQDLNKHSSRCTKVYKCQECKIRFKTALECLKHHNEKHQIKHPLLKNKEEETVKSPAKNTFNCKKCNKSFKTAVLCLDHHNKTHKKDKLKEELKISKFSCDKCSSVYTNAGAYLEHYEKKHKPKTDRLCDKCGAFPKNLSVHALGVCSGPQTCHICKKICTSICGLKQHIDTSHANKEKQQICHICGKTFRYSHSLRKHMKTHDKQRVKNVECSKCPKKFFTKNNLYTHMRHFHGSEMKFVCDICNRGFLRNDYLMRHLKIHEPGRVSTVRLKSGVSFLCDICDRNYSRKDNFRRHLKSHGIFFTPKYRLPSRYDCEACELVFTDVNKFQLHLKQSHDSAYRRKWKCDICGLVYLTYAARQKHRKLHTNNNSLWCRVCYKKFHTKSELEIHERLHTVRKKSYKCRECGESFARNFMLENHLLTNHRNTEVKIYSSMPQL